MDFYRFKSTINYARKLCGHSISINQEIHFATFGFDYFKSINGQMYSLKTVKICWTDAGTDADAKKKIH